MALVLCLIFMVIELVYGILAHSLALITDAAHMLTDVGAMSMSLMAIQLAKKSANKKYTFGWHRAEVIGAFGSVLTIWALVGVILYEGTQRIYDFYMCNYNTTPADCEGVDGKTMLIVGGAGFGINILVAIVLGFGGAGHTHSHGGGDDHGHSHGGGEHEGNLNLRGAFLHALGDCIQSVGVMIAAAVIWIGNEKTYGKTIVPHSPYNIADPACSILFAIITLFTTTGLFKQLLHILMETVPGNVNYDRLLKDLLAIPTVASVHDLHVWSLTTDKLSMSVHLVSPNHQQALEAAQDVCGRHGISHSTIQVDAPDSEHVTRCASNLACA
jgi:zinc transporter 2